LLGATNTRVIGNLVNGNAGDQINSGGIVVASAAALTHGSDPKSDTIKNNNAHHNQPADLIWDNTGTVRFAGNHCTMSVPSGHCSWCESGPSVSTAPRAALSGARPWACPRQGSTSPGRRWPVFAGARPALRYVGLPG